MTKKNTYLHSTGQRWKINVAHAVLFLGFGFILVGFTQLNNPGDLSVVLILGGTLLGIIAFVFELATLRCKKCGTNLAWKRLTGNWKYISKECPVCHDRG